MMKLPLLETKVRVPPLPPHVLPRPRLVQALAQGLPYARLGLVAAPAGYGKTTLLAQWARETEAQVAWLSLDERDDEALPFFRYLLAAWAQVQPDVTESDLGLLLSDMAPDGDALLTTFLNVAGARSERLVFVLDDYHLVEEDAIHAALTFLLDHLPPLLSFVLTCRAQPPLPLARYRARRQLLELGSAELAFSRSETEALLQSQKGSLPQEEAVARLHRESEGWAAGLQLATLGLRREANESAAPGGGRGQRALLSGKQRFVADYLAQDVLAQQEPAVRAFLLRTAFLQRLSAPLCAVMMADDVAIADDAVSRDDVAGVGDLGAAQAMLQRVARGNLFLAPLDDSGQWYRYHRLFAEFLQEEARQQLAPHLLTELQRRAAVWHLAHDLPQAAFNHALAAADLPLVVRIFERHFFTKLHAGEFRLLQDWLDALPAEWFKAYPTLLLARAGICVATGALDASFRCVEEIERDLDPPQSDDDRRHLARATAVRCFLACYQNDLPRAEGYAGRALQALHEEDVTFRADTYVALGDAYRAHGRWQEAEHAYRQVLELATRAPYDDLSVHAYGALADLELRQGRLQNAAAYWRKALEILGQSSSWGRISLTDSGWFYIRLGEILYEWNALQEAEAHLSQGLQRATLSGDARARLAGALLAGRLALTRGDLQTAHTHLQQARSLLQSAPPGEAHGRFERLQLELWLARDELRAALAWAAERLEGETGDAQGDAQGDDQQRRLALARLQIAHADVPSLQEASRVLARLQDDVAERGRTGLLIEAQTLHALAQWRLGDEAAALTSLQESLTTAEPQGYTRLFADLGLPMARLLQEAAARQVMPDYVSGLLAAFDEGPLLPGAVDDSLPEPLTPREEEVLALMAAGLTNREIGEQLVISSQTVKKHAGNIYGKLGVGNRTEAVARARRLRLLD